MKYRLYSLICLMVVMVSNGYADNQLPSAVRQSLIKHLNESYNTPAGGKVFSLNIDQSAEGTVTDILKAYGEVNKVYCARCTIDALAWDPHISLEKNKPYFSRRVLQIPAIIILMRSGQFRHFNPLDEEWKDYYDIASPDEDMWKAAMRLDQKVWSKTCPFRMPDLVK